MANIGRNAPCPCGSGRKYKKCCLKKDEAAQLHKATTAREETGRARFTVPNSEGQRHRMHPYAVAQMLDSPDAWEIAAKKGLPLKELWIPTKVAAMNTEEIEVRLRELEVDPSRERFLELAEERTSAWEISRLWLEEVPKERLDADADDFAGVAACELWKRFCPDRPSIEMLDDLMQEGCGHFVEQRFTQACDRWLELWQVLLERLTPEMRSTEDADELVAGTQSIFNWIQDFSDSLHNATIDDVRYAEPAMAVFNQALDAFPDEHVSTRNLFRTEMAFMYYHLGREEDGERILLDLIKEQPDRATGYVCLSDELSSCPPGGDQPRDLDRAISLLEQALERPVVDADDWDVERRLKYLRDLRKVETTGFPGKH